MRKTIIFMSVLMVLLIIGVTAAPSIYKNFLPAANIVKLSEMKFTETVVATGIVNTPDSRSILTEIPIVVSEVCVSQGDVIEEGQVICTVNRDATVRYIMSLAASSPVLGAVDYSALTELIPEEISSPYSGCIESIIAKSGSSIGAEGTVAIVSGEGSLYVEAYISEKNISKIREGQEVIINGTGFGDRQYRGTIDYIAGSAIRKYNGTIEETVVDIRIRLDDADENVKSGYTADLTIPVSDEELLRLAPYEAVESDESGSFVYVFSNGMAIRRNISTGRELSGGIEVTGGLYSGDYILSPAESLSDGEYVLITINSD